MSVQHSIHSLHSLRVVFFGTPDFSVPTLEALIQNTTVVGVVTQPDKPVGRKQILTAPPIKLLAERHSIPVFQPTSIRSSTVAGAAFQKEFAALRPEIAVVVAYGKIIPKSLLTQPQYGFVNIHGSVLPQLRGASPIQQAILTGLEYSGVTIMLMDAGMDTGPILAIGQVPLAPKETAETLHDTLKMLGANLLIDTLAHTISGTITPIEQNEAEATYCQLIQKEDGKIDWSKPPVDIERMIRAYTPWPGVFTFCPDGKRVRILQASLTYDQQLQIETVQPEGKKPMTYAAFLQGNPDCSLPPIM